MNIKYIYIYIYIYVYMYIFNLLHTIPFFCFNDSPVFYKKDIPYFWSCIVGLSCAPWLSNTFWDKIPPTMIYQVLEQLIWVMFLNLIWVNTFSVFAFEFKHFICCWIEMCIWFGWDVFVFVPKWVFGPNPVFNTLYLKAADKMDLFCCSIGH